VKTVSVKQVAEALGVTPRAIIYKIEKGDLKGTRSENQYGVKEWRIYPTREIADKLKSTRSKDTTAEEIDFEPDMVDVVEAESTGGTERPSSEKVEANWLDVERERLKILAEEMTRPLVETIRQQERLIEEQKRQLKLLPDLERQATFEREQAAKEREAVQLVAHERDALQKQVAALELDKDVAEEQRHLAEQEKAKAEEALKELESLKATVEKLERPFWKKWFRSK
jgi:hypothetical protein